MNYDYGEPELTQEPISKKPPAQNDSALVELYQSCMEEKRAQMNALWESARFFLTVFTALTTVSLGGAFTILGENLKVGGYGILAIGAIQWVNFVIVMHGKTQLTNIYRNFLESVATIGKAAYMLGFFDIIPSVNGKNVTRTLTVLSEDKMLLSPRHYQNLLISKSTPDFIQKGLSSKGSWYSSMSFIYRILAVLSLLMALGFTGYGLWHIFRS